MLIRILSCHVYGSSWAYRQVQVLSVLQVVYLLLNLLKIMLLREVSVDVSRRFHRRNDF